VSRVDTLRVDLQRGQAESRVEIVQEQLISAQLDFAELLGAEPRRRLRAGTDAGPGNESTTSGNGDTDRAQQPAGLRTSDAGLSGCRAWCARVAALLVAGREAGDEI